MTENVRKLIDDMLAGDRLALSRVMSIVENRRDGTAEIMSRVQERRGGARVIGVTGPPGAGKSTLLDQLIRFYRNAGSRVGVAAVDPSSPISGGALLGDRIRMQRHGVDSDVFIRSLSARGAHGGLARAARDISQLLDAFGFDVVIVETVGVGQGEFDIVRLAPTVVVVLTPQAGDTVQAMKAGLLEVADVFVVNKADLDGAVKIKTELEQMLHMQPAGEWDVPVVLTVAEQGQGIDELAAALDRHAEYLASSGTGATRAASGRVKEFASNLADEIVVRVHRQMQNGRFSSLRERLERGDTDPYGAVQEVLREPDLLHQVIADRGEASGGSQ